MSHFALYYHVWYDYKERQCLLLYNKPQFLSDLKLFSNPSCFLSAFLEVYNKTDIQLAAGQVIRDCVLMVVDVRDPIIRACILYVEQVEHIESQPDVFQVAEEAPVHDRIRSSGKLVRETEVYTLVGRRAEITVFIACTRGCDGKAAGQYAFQIQLDTLVAGEIILEKDRYVISLAVRHRNIFAAPDALFRLHQREADPGDGER